jgi:uncharacterized repeat protein (TIGR01451 family)
MEKWKFCGLIVALVCLLMFAPVAACHADIGKTGPGEICANTKMTYTITATLRDANHYYLKVVDYLPTGATYDSSSPSGSYDPNGAGAGKGTVTWIYTKADVTQNVQKTMTVTVKYANPATYKNSVKSWVSQYGPQDSPPHSYSWGGEQQKIDIVTTIVKSCSVTIRKTVDKDTACVNEDDYLTYTLYPTYTGLDNQAVKVEDVLPAGLSYVSSTPPGSYDSVSRIVSWNFPSVNSPWSPELQLVVNPISIGNLENTATITDALLSLTATSDTVTTDSDTCGGGVPEFPSIALPVGMILGVAFIVYSVRNRKE